MNAARRLVPLGFPQNAVKLNGVATKFLVSPGAEVLATNLTHTETIITAGRGSQTSLVQMKDVATDHPWRLRRDVVLAQSEGTSVVHSPGGLYRIDITSGSSFVCDPAKVVGVVGQLNFQPIYAESRLDLARAWLKLGWRSTLSFAHRSYQWVFALLAKIPWPQQLRRSQFQRVQLPQIPAGLLKFWSQSRGLVRRVNKDLSERTFKYTHPKKLRIEGLGSVLLRT